MNRTRIDHALGAAVRDGAIPGIVALAADRDGIVYEGAFGRRHADDPAAMTLDTVFWIASMTKAITSAAAMQLVEQGRLTLDAPIANVLPEIAAVQVLEGFGPDGTPQLRPQRRPITLRHLLTHTAGFGYNMWNADLCRYMALHEIPGVISGQVRAFAAPLLFDPGERWEYSIGIDWAGKVVETVSGERLDIYLHDHIFAPLGMRDTGFRLTERQRARLAGMHARTEDGGAQPIPFEVAQEPEFHMGGGGLYGTAPDYMKFARAILHGGSLGAARILRPETVALMSRNQIGELRVRPMRTVMPHLSADTEFFPGTSKTWGLGFMINEEPAPTGRAAGSLAWAGLGNTYYWIDPERGRAGVLMAQLLPFADPLVLDAFARFETAVYAP